MYTVKHERLPVDFTTISVNDINNWLKRIKPTTSSLVVVADAHLDELDLDDSVKVYSLSQICDLKSLDKFDALYWATDRVDLHAKVARHFISNKKIFSPINGFEPARTWFHDPVKESVLAKEFELQGEEGIEKFGHGTGADFGNLLQLIDQTSEMDGVYLEVGTFFGSSGCVMLRYMKERNIEKDFYFYDVFEGFNYPEALESVDTYWKNTHATDGIDAVKNRLSQRALDDERVHVIMRNICEENALEEVKDPICFANIDVDIYEGVYAALHQVFRKLISGGIIVCEDAGHTPSLLGANAALNQFVDEVGRNRFTIIQMESGQYVLIKK